MKVLFMKKEKVYSLARLKPTSASLVYLRKFQNHLKGNNNAKVNSQVNCDRLL